MKLVTCLLVLFPAFAFAETSTYICNYTSYSNQQGNHKVKNKFELTFLLDNKTGKSYLLGNNGSSEVELFESTDRLAFMEITQSGNVMTTAIDSLLNSVHSRNLIIAGKIFPSQYYGKCKVK